MLIFIVLGVLKHIVVVMGLQGSRVLQGCSGSWVSGGFFNCVSCGEGGEWGGLLKPDLMSGGA